MNRIGKNMMPSNTFLLKVNWNLELFSSVQSVHHSICLNLVLRRSLTISSYAQGGYLSWTTNKILKVIKNNLIKECSEVFSYLSENANAHNKVHEAFSKNLKLGIHEDCTNMVKIAILLRYHFIKSGDDQTSFEDNVGRMKKNHPGN